MKKLLAMLLAVAMVLSMAVMVSAEETGSVYYLNFKPEFDGALQELAATYTAKTGVQVKVVTAASGQYSDTLTGEMSKSSAPTIFNIGNMSGLEDWDDYALDLTDTAIAAELNTDAFNLYNAEGELKAIPNCYESFGIIVNTKLLEKAGHSLDEIVDFASLKAVADDIHARADELGFDAFSAAGLDSSSSWRFSGHLANMPLYYEFRDDEVTEMPATITGAYMDNFKNIWDLYITDSAADATSLTTSTGDESKAQFIEGKAAFYQNGTWEYAGLIDGGMTDDELAMIPIYCGVEAKRMLLCAPAPRTAGPSMPRLPRLTSRLPSTSWCGWLPTPMPPLLMLHSWAPFPSSTAPTPPTSSSLTATLCWPRASTL